MGGGGEVRRTDDGNGGLWESADLRDGSCILRPGIIETSNTQKVVNIWVSTGLHDVLSRFYRLGYQVLRFQ